MLCLSINETNLSKIKEIVQKFKFFELRLDLCDLSPSELDEILKLNNNCIVTPFEDPGKYEKHLEIAAKNRVKYIDLPFTEDFRDHIPKNLDKSGIILSFHTDKFMYVEKLIHIAKKMRQQHEGLIKIVPTAYAEISTDNVLALYKHFDNIIAFCSGEKGQRGRYTALAYGCPIMYIALDEDSKTDPGQYTPKSLKEEEKKRNMLRSLLPNLKKMISNNE